MEEPTSRALELVRRARRRATFDRARRALFAGIAASALLAAAAAAVALALGTPPGAWLWLSALAFPPVALIGLVRARPSLSAAALLLDRAAGTRERFVASLGAADPEVRDLVSRQALSAPAISGGRFPLTFPPSREGLAAVVSVALLAALLLLGPKLVPAPATGERTASVPMPGAPGSSPAEPDPGSAGPVPPGPMAKTKPLAERILEGDDLSEGDWQDLRSAGLTEDEREAIRAAIASGDRESAAKAARAALRRAGDPAGPAPGAAARDWTAYERALEAPGWHPRFDRVVRAYFVSSGQRGLRED